MTRLSLHAALLALLSCGCTARSLQTPLENSGFAHVSSAAERSAYLDRIAAHRWPDRRVEVGVVGVSAGGMSIEAARVAQPRAGEGLRVLLLAGQHGMEPSGSEALLILLRELALGQAGSGMEVLLIPAANPDGLERGRRVNCNDVNISTDFALLSQPESRALSSVLLRFKPHLVLDVHESAVYKKRTLGSQGYLTDFEAQLEYANNPNIPQPVLDYSREHMLPRLLAAVEAQGLPVGRYIGEITSVAQPLSHGGLSARNFRNRAALAGALSFLLENRLDPSFGEYPTPRNIKERVRKQLASLHAFLDVAEGAAEEIRRLSDAARAAPAPRGYRLAPRYGPAAAAASITIPLREIGSGRRVERSFPDHTGVEQGPLAAAPPAYVARGNTRRFEEWLAAQGIRGAAGRTLDGAACCAVHVGGGESRWLPLFLEPASSSSINAALAAEGVFVAAERAAGECR